MENINSFNTFQGVVLLSWVILSIVITFIGGNRKIGGGGAFLCSFLLSPIVGFIVVAFSKDLEVEKREEEIRSNIARQTEILNELKKKYLPDQNKEENQK